MERKTKQRILGIVVVVALVIILLPLFQSGKEVPSEAMLVKAPPFPDQSVQVTAPAQVQSQTASNATPVASDQQSGDTAQLAMKKISQQPDDTIKLDSNNVNSQSQVTTSANQDPSANTNVMSATLTSEATTNTSAKINDSTANSTAATTNTDAAVKTAELTSSGAPSDIWSEEEQQEKNQPAPKTIMSDDESAALVKAAEQRSGNNKKINTAKLNTAKVLQETELTADGKKVTHLSKRIHTAKIKSTPYIRTPDIRTPVNSDGLLSLKNAVWVIQVGSFKNKANALRLVNQLRASGYKAFIQQFANNTRVFVGPEIKQGSARALASRLESELQIRGIVLSYKPLAL